MSEYLKDILSTYEKKKQEMALSIRLSNPTPANIRLECISIYRTRHKPTEDKILTEFVTPDKDGKLSLKSFDSVNAETFKQVPRIIKGEVPNPGLKYIELIAWLIDFNPRPSLIYYTTKKNKKKLDILILKPIYTILLIIAISGLALLLLITRKENPDNSKFNTSLKQHCMYWLIDHYEPVDCNKTMRGIPIMPYNSHIMANLKKIMLPDTLTKFSLEKVWYSRINGHYEYFTDSGMHPIDTVKRLRPLTTNILQKYTSNDRYAMQRLNQTINLIITAIIIIVLIIAAILLKKKLKKPH